MPLRRLPGGQGVTYRSGDIILKPTDRPFESEWGAELFDRLSGPGFQVPHPVRTAQGTWIVDGWCAWRRFEGRHMRGRWGERLEACSAFHHALRKVPNPGFLASRTDPWSIADRMAWEEEAIECLRVTRSHVNRLLPLLEPADSPNQLIHGDIAENFLLKAGEAPCVIDFAPYWRPAWFAAAILVVDAVTWGGANPRLIAESGLSRAMLARGALRRILEHDLHHRLGNRASLHDLPAYETLLRHLDLPTLG